MSPEKRLVELGIELPVPPTLPFTPRLKLLVVHGGLAYLSGNGDFGCLGRVGDDVDLERAAIAARTTAGAYHRRRSVLPSRQSGRRPSLIGSVGGLSLRRRAAHADAAERPTAE